MQIQVLLKRWLLSINTFTTGQWDTIKTLAMQCPFVAGDAVYMARALYAQYDNTIFFDDLAICTPIPPDSDRMFMLPNSSMDSIVTDTAKSHDYILVFPNPASNILKVFYSSQSNATITFELTDMMGQKIISAPVASMTTIELDVSNIASSLYLWRGRSGRMIIQSGKISINR